MGEYVQLQQNLMLLRSMVVARPREGHETTCRRGCGNQTGLSVGPSSQVANVNVSGKKDTLMTSAIERTERVVLAAATAVLSKIHSKMTWRPFVGMHRC
jgi:hypothetical protein